MEVSSCVVQGKKMYIVVCVATLTSRVKGFHAYKKQVEMPCKYLIYADKKLKSKIRTMLRKASM